MLQQNGKNVIAATVHFVTYCCVQVVCHCSFQLSAENEQLKRKLLRLKQQNAELLRQINDYRDKQRMDAMMKQFVTTRK